MITVPYRHRWRAVAAIIAACYALAVFAADAAAHARLVDASPVSGSALAELPAELVLTFSEPVVPASASLALTREDGSQISLGSIRFEENDHRLRATIDRPPQIQGTLQLSWSVRSATDGHDSAGIVAFTVGTGRAPVGVSGSGTERDPWWQIAVRALWLLALALIAAGFIAALAMRRFLHRGAMLAAATVSIGSALALIHVWNGLDAATSSDRLHLAAGIAGAVGASLLLLQSRLAAIVAAAAWSAAIICLAAAGHAAGVEQSTLATGVVSLHTALGLLWLGALAALLVAASAAAFRAALTWYSRIAVGGVLALAAAGILFVPFQVVRNRDIADSTYGRTLLVKTAIVLLVLAIAATNRWVVRPIVGAGAPGAIGQARIVMGIELAALAGVVSLAAVLSSTAPPARTAVTQVAAPLRQIEQQATAGELQVRLTGSIAGTGDDALRIAVSPADGIQRVIVTTSYQDPETGELRQGERLDANPIAEQPGQYEMSALHLSRQAPWALDVTVRRAGLLDTAVSFVVDTSEWQAEQPRISGKHWSWPIVSASAWALLALALLLPVAGIAVIRRHGQVAPLSGAILMVALAMITTGFAIQGWQRTAPRTSGHGLAAPSPFDPVAAQANYDALCLACHGPNGAGIGTTDPLHQHGSGTNLVDPRSQVLSDGDIYTLISEGIGDTDMPAYDLALSDVERWDLVAYLRRLQASPPDSTITAAP